jgi:Protein of unknown function (DUF2723)
VEKSPADRGAAALAAGATAVFFVVYARRLCPTLSLTGDSAELVTAAAVWGVPHAPGYPLFTTLAHAFTWLPLHEVAWRVHLTSAVFHAATVGATVNATFAISKSRLAALAAGVALGLQRSFFAGSLYAEVFPLNDLFFAALLSLALRLRSREAAPLAFVLVAGLAASHHMLIALAVPGLAMLAYRPLKDQPRRLVLAVAFVLPIALAYALVPLAASRHPAVSWGEVHDARSLLSLVTRSDYGGLFSSVHGAGHGTGPERIAALGGLLASAFGVFTLLFAVAGTVDLLRRQLLVGSSLLVAAFTTGPLLAWLNALGTSSEEGLAFFERFTTMCAVPIAIAFGAGVAAAIRLSASSFARAAGSVALAGWAVLSFLRVGSVDLSRDRRGIAFAHDLLLRAPDRSLLLLSGDAAGGAALYVCAIEKRCGDRVPLAPGSLFLPWAMAQARRLHPDVEIPWSSGPALRRTHELAAAEAMKRPVFVAPDLLEKDPLLASAFTPLPDHLLFRLWPPGTDSTEPRETFLRSARAMAGDDRDACEGCELPPPADHPTQEMEIVLAYSAASFNHARTAAGIPEARDLVQPLLARAGDYAQRGGASMSRNSSSSSR